jgi:hypothetical protein
MQYSIYLRYRLGYGFAIGSSTSGRSGEFFSSPPMSPDRHWEPPSLLSNEYRVFFPRGEGGDKAAGEKETWRCRRLHNEEPHSLNPLQNIIVKIKVKLSLCFYF